MLDISSDTATASATATVCENLATFGAAPERGELDSREVWDEDDTMEALSEAIRVIVDGITVDGTQMADEREALMWGFVNMLHSPGPEARPRRRSHRARDERPRARAGRHRGEGLGAAAAHRPRPQLRRSPRRLREDARPRR